MNTIAARGFTLVEMLTVITILAIVAAAAIPLLSANDPQKLNVAAEETANTLRFAFSEARRTGGYVLVDGKTTAGRLQLFYSSSSAQVPPVVGTAVINDPVTKRAAVLNVNASAFSQGVTLTPRFKAGGIDRTQLLIGPGLAQLQGFDGAGVNLGALQANSDVLLSLGSQSTTVGVNYLTGLVTSP
jgi:prepilin-type N-terminal cleavage/methylation domain-containing protein